MSNKVIKSRKLQFKKKERESDKERERERESYFSSKRKRERAPHSLSEQSKPKKVREKKIEK